MSISFLPLAEVAEVTTGVSDYKLSNRFKKRKRKHYLRAIVQDKLLVFGWILLFISSVFYYTEQSIAIASGEAFGFFVIHYGAALIYFFVLVFSRSSMIEEHRIHYRIINLVLFLISAYALNKEIEVFAASPLWLSILLVTVCLNYLSGAFFSVSPKWSQSLFFFLCGIAMVLFCYLSLYLMPLYMLSVFALVALGLSLHTFIPVLFSYYTVKLVSQLAQNNKRRWLSFIAGILTALIICTVFIVWWNKTVQQINQTYSTAIVEGDESLPVWVQVAQKADNNGITAKVLETDLIYKTSNWESNFFWNVPQRAFTDEQKLHDPLVVLGNFFSERVLLPEDDRVKILESQYNLRHEAIERLRSGEHLTTNQVTTNVRVWPKLHLAYTEKFITVYNNQQNVGWSNQGEAIYTFHMPEGAVVTSLSLWINDREEKGILTSKEKADSAYTTIVGHESRDPSVVHWQEGNTVVVRVFPVTAQSSRTFKVGITAPLRNEGNQLFYDNIWFNGPGANSAKQTIKLEVTDSPESFVQRTSFKSLNANTFNSSGTYEPYWKIAFKDPGFQTNSFSFNGYQYSIQPYQPKYSSADITDVYLDINQSWTSNEFEKIWPVIKNKKVWIYDGGIKALNEASKDDLFASLQKLQFSLFPFQLIHDKEHALVISKSTQYSPNISDLEESSFLKSLKENTNKDQRIKLFHLGSELSPFLRSLNEFRLFDFECGDTKHLQQLLEQKNWIKNAEGDNQVIIYSAKAVVSKIKGESSSNAPDHLMRLYAYNDIMKKLGTDGLTKTIDPSQLVSEAQEAYIVSPVSSLVVLESQSDYDRFNITDSENSLKNASLKNKGAVPEPGEWAILIVVAAVFVFFLLKWKML